MTDRIDALRRALDASPNDDTLRLIYAEALEEIGRGPEALAEYETLLAREALPAETCLGAGGLAVEHGRIDLARGLLERARGAGVVEGVGALEQRINEALLERDGLRVQTGPASDDKVAWSIDPEERVTFDQVGGLADVKRAINRAIVLPQSRPDLYEKYGRRSGGGLLLYGPPGCGKTLLARATAGECGLPFYNVRIEQILDPFLGNSERNLHAAFEFARAQAPCVLFLDEIDALGFARRKSAAGTMRGVVDVLLQELDSIGSDNTNVLIMAATNAPWDVDDAFLRPGRFGTRMFVGPPDEEAREAILAIHLKNVPHEPFNLRSLAKTTPLFSGADLGAIVERAVDVAIDRALEEGGEPPVREADLMSGVTAVRPTTLEWLERARNYVEFANRGERYEEVAEYLKRRDVKRLFK